MSLPILLIFDIDATLIHPDIYNTHSDVRKGLYDPELLTPYLTNPNKFQVAIASYNTDLRPYVAPPLGGRRLGRAILDIQHPEQDSRAVVEDEFIQAWMVSTWGEVDTHGKNKHIKLILDAYKQKHGGHPPTVIFYDDQIHNVYLAGKIGIHSFWVTEGVKRDNITRLPKIGNRVQFVFEGNHLAQCVREKLRGILNYITKHPSGKNTTPLYSIYLPMCIDNARIAFAEFRNRAGECGLRIHTIASDINHIV